MASICLPRSTAHRHHILHRIAFLPEMRYACAAPIVETRTIDIGTVSHLPSSVKRICSFARRRSRSAPGALRNLSPNGMLSGNQRQLQHMNRECHERCMPISPLRTVKSLCAPICAPLKPWRPCDQPVLSFFPFHSKLRGERDHRGVVEDFMVFLQAGEYISKDNTLACSDGAHAHQRE